MGDLNLSKPKSDASDPTFHRLRVIHAKLRWQLYTWRGEANTKKARRWRKKYLRLMAGNDA